MPTPLETLTAELEAVTKAVNAAYSGAEYEIVSGGTRRRLKRQDLSLLLRRKAELELSIGRLGGTVSGGGISYGVVVDSNSCLNQ
jgi:hypothetical protein